MSVLNMNFPTGLAHGALGWWDEVIFLGIIIVFLGLMGVSWLRSRNIEADEIDPAQVNQETTTETDSPERFRLD
jgi:hypothetical protein